MRGNLAVRVNDGTTDRIVTARTKGLRFRKTAPGGHHSASMQLSVPRDTFSDLGPADRVIISDTRTARTLWDGYTENPGVQDGPAGVSYDLSAVGGMVLTQDMSTPLVFIERSLDDTLWIRLDESGGTSDVIGAGNNISKMQFPSGIPVGSGSEVQVAYYGLTRTGMRLAAVESQIVAGKTDSGYLIEAQAVDEGVAFYTAFSYPFSTTVTPIGGQVITTFPDSCETVVLKITRSGGATNVADDATWGEFIAPYIRPILKTKLGVDITNPADYLTPVVRAYEVVNHLLGAVMPLFDAAASQVDTTVTYITQLTFHDGATPQQVLDGLALFEPDFLWEVLERTGTDRHRFNYRAWPTTPRYEVSTQDGYRAPGGEADLCNRVVVYWTDPLGARQSTVVTQSVPELGARTRDAQPITLPVGLGSADNAQRAGEIVLAQKATVAKSATVTVRRPIVDRDTGSLVMPWEIEPGHLVRIRETGEDLRLTEMEYVDADCAATLTLGTPVRSVDQILADLMARALR